MVSFNDADDFMSTMAEGGNKAYRFEDIDGIGPQTAKKIKSVRGVNAPTDVADMSADELSDKAGISHSRATKAIKGGGGNPNVSKRNKNTGSVSAAGIKTKQGDFMVGFGDLDRARARNDPRSRSEEAVRMDEQKRAPVTTNYEKWKDNPARWDFPGVDTPTQDPKALPKDYKAGDPRTTDVNEEEEVATSTGNDLPFMRDIGGESMLAGDVANEGPEGSAPGVAPNDFEQEPDTPSQTMGPEPSSQRLPETVRQGLASGESADLAFTKAERERTSEKKSQQPELPMQPYQSRNSGPPSQIGPYELIQDSQDDGMRSIAYEEPESERTVSFQKRNTELEGADATVDVWWEENAETVYEGSPDDAFGVFINELEDRREQNKERTGNESGIQSRQSERAEAMANLFGI